MRWTHPDRGLPQGCPLSPVISAAVTHVWACYVFGANLSLSSPVTGYGYIDDRLLLLRSNQDAAALTCAVDRSSRFDQAFCLEVSVAKCSVVAAPNDRECAALASTLGYKFEQHFDALGVQAQWGRPWRLLRYSLRKATCRLCALRSLRLPSQRTRALVRSLVLPAVTWAASFATPTEDDLWLLQREVEHCMRALAGHGAAKVLFFELLGWHLEPCFAIDERILRDMWRAIVSPGLWTEELPLAQLSGWVSSSLPNLGSTLSRLGWTLSQDGRSVGSHDIDGGSRSIAIGCESFVGLQQWLIAHYRCKYIARLDRLWKPQLRTRDMLSGYSCPCRPDVLNMASKVIAWLSLPLLKVDMLPWPVSGPVPAPGISMPVATLRKITPDTPVCVMLASLLALTWPGIAPACLSQPRCSFRRTVPLDAFVLCLAAASHPRHRASIRRGFLRNWWRPSGRMCTVAAFTWQLMDPVARGWEPWAGPFSYLPIACPRATHFRTSPPSGSFCFRPWRLSSWVRCAPTPGYVVK